MEMNNLIRDDGLKPAGRRSPGELHENPLHLGNLTCERAVRRKCPKPVPKWAD